MCYVIRLDPVDEQRHRLIDPDIDNDKLCVEVNTHEKTGMV